ncbi:MAG TPA: L-threonylcarbamoyladenylate synthase [Bacteroidia bacterium]|jgi:L-threonylcarbamoyladenylate synthase|nr:L-threonylcarbamoyladenylate synthase [Bacteroidia bacterium]
MQTITGTDISFAAELLRKGELVAIPTETVYGLAANALNTEAVLKIYETKGRPLFNPLIVHVHDVKQFEKYAKEIPELVYKLAEKFSPGPLTFVLRKKDIVPDIVTGGGETVALRVPGHPLTLGLLKQLEFPLAAPSANPFGYISPVNAWHVKEQLDGKIPYILDGGNCMVGVESTVIAVHGNEIELLRVGGVSIEDLYLVAADADIHRAGDTTIKSPGQLKSHYAPKTTLYHGEMKNLMLRFRELKKAVLSFDQKYPGDHIVAEEVLSANGDLKEAARNLFTAMRKLDESGADVILAEKFPDHGLGVAINDRLERASA